VKRFQVLILVAAVVAGVAGVRVLLRDDGPKPFVDPQEQPAGTATGRTVPLDLAPLPPTLTKEGTFVCAELKNANGTYTARAEGGRIINVSGGPLTYGFTFEVSAGAKAESVQSRFRLNDGQRVPSVTMASKSVQTPVTKCALRIFAAEVTADDVATVEAAAKAAGCGPIIRHESDGHDHINPPERGTYSTTPPTSGNHYAAPASTGVHDRPIPDETQVHNLEHGHVGLQYRGVSGPVRSVLDDVANGDAAWTFAAPYPSMDAAITMTAWVVSLECAVAPQETGELADLARAFVAVFRDHGRESIPGTS